MICPFVDAKKKRTIKVSVEPTEAQISIDGLYVGDGLATFDISKDEGFIVIKAECPGYKTGTAKFYFKDSRDAVSFKLRRDASADYLSATDLANKYFTINISPSLLEQDQDGNISTKKAWRIVQNIILSYFDEIQSMDLTTGYFQTPWEYTKVPELDFAIRTRVTIKENTLGENVTFQVKVSSERSTSVARVEGWTEQPYILKKFQPVIEELQSRLESKK
jgi:hypothetical protein